MIRHSWKELKFILTFQSWLWYSSHFNILTQSIPIHEKKLNPQKRCISILSYKFIPFIKVENIDVLHLDGVLGKYCKPKPEACHCKTMLDKLLRLNPKIDRIEGQFLADHFMKGCRCYLGSAARAEFKYVELGGFKKLCQGKIDFDEHDYEKNKCGGVKEKITII